MTQRKVLGEEWPPGTVIGGKYTVISKLGPRSIEGYQDGQDEAVSVYRVQSLEWEEPRSLRVLETAVAGDVAAREFRRTARLLLKLDHPNVVAAEATGDAVDGRPFLATELAEGKTLADLIRAEGPLDPLRVCSLSLQIAAALESAHDLGLLHLGLSASNILVSGPAGRERVKVDGFGAAYVRASRIRQARNGGQPSALALEDLIPANPAYAAPEQALGASPELLDARADEYSLGVLMYQMLAGRLPFWSPAPMGGSTGESPEIANGELRLAWLVSHLEDSPLPLASMDSLSELPQPLTSLVTALLEKRPELRPATMRAVVEKITLAGDALVSRPLPEEQPQAAEEEATLASAPEPADTPEPVVTAAEPAAAPVVLPIHSEEAPLATPQADPCIEAALEALASLDRDAAVQAPGAVPIAAFEDAPIKPAAPVERLEPPSKIADSDGVLATPPGWQDSASIFQTVLTPEPAHRSRAVWATLAILVVAAGVWFFITRGRQQWLGSGPLNPMKPDELRTIEGANSPSGTATPSAQPPSATAPEQTTNPAPGQPSSAPAPSGAIANQPSSAAAPSGPVTPPANPVPSAQPNTAGQSPVTVNGGLEAAASPAQTSAGQTSGTLSEVQPVPSPRAAAGPAKRTGAATVPRATNPLSAPGDIAAAVHRAVTAGDVFFALGQYDLAVQTYQKPLKRDPKNKQLLARIQRAQKAKAAEAQYLGQ